MYFKSINKLIRKAKSIALFSHTNIDADGLSGLLAFYLCLKEKNKNVDIFVEEIPYELNYLDMKNIVKYDFGNSHYDLLISLDCSTLDRLGKFKTNFVGETINIDHHASNENYARINIVDSNASSACELLYSVIKSMKTKITKQIATALYSGIAGDTGGFIHSNVTAKTFEIASKLKSYDADTVLVNKKQFQTTSKESFDLLKIILSNTIIEDEVAICIISQSEYSFITNTEKMSKKDYVNLLLSIEGVNISILSVEKNDEYNISIRTSGNYDANRIASAMGGGGHKHAAGCKFHGKKNIIMEKLLSEAKREIYETRN